METILVTGGAGAIGSNLCNTLSQQGNKVVVVDNLTSGTFTRLHDSIQCLEGDIADEDFIEHAFDCKPDKVFHLAAFFANQNSVEHPDRDLSANGQGIINILNASVRHGVSKVLYTSSSCVYGSMRNMTEDRHAEVFDTPYAITKFLGEKYCQFWSAHHGLNTVIMRLFNSYGPGEVPGQYRNVIPNFFRLAFAGKPLTITGTGEETRDFNFVGDTVNGLIAAIDADTVPASIYNLASGKGTSILEVAETINELTGNKAGIVFKERRDWDTIAHRVGNAEKAKSDFGYQPKTQLKEGLKLTYQWFDDENIR